MVELTNSRNDLVTIFGHELRNHVAPIKSVAELLRRSALDAPTALRLAAMLERQTDGMMRLLDELTVAANGVSPEISLRRVRTTIDTIVRHAVEMSEPLISARSQSLAIRLPAGAVYLEADTLWLTRAVHNVIANAAKYTDPGGRIRIDVLDVGTAVEINVRDTGVGLAPAELETVFGLYAQVAQCSSRPPAGGLGVGLHLARFVLNAHGGSIRAMSEGRGRGSTFAIRLPCGAVGAPRAEPRAATPRENSTTAGAGSAQNT